MLEDALLAYADGESDATDYDAVCQLAWELGKLSELPPEKMRAWLRGMSWAAYDIATEYLKLDDEDY
jgi:hypothetical protein